MIEEKIKVPAVKEILWQSYPKTASTPKEVLPIISAFKKHLKEIYSYDPSHYRQNSNAVLETIRPDLEASGYVVERSKKQEGLIPVSVLYGQNDKPIKSFYADAFNKETRTVLEVEAGQAVINYKFLKDIFEACMMDNVDYLAVAVKQVYVLNNGIGHYDFQTVCDGFLDTIYASNGITFKLKGIVIIGY